MYDIRLLSARGRLFFAGLFASIVSVGVAVGLLVALDLSTRSAALALLSGVIMGLIAYRLLERWKLAPLTERMRIRQSRRLESDPSTITMRYQDQASIDAHLDALLTHLDAIDQRRILTLHELEQTRAELAALHATSHEQREQREARSEVLQREVRALEARKALVTDAVHSAMGLTERVIQTLTGALSAQHGSGGPEQPPPENVDALSALALDTLERVREATRWSGLPPEDNARGAGGGAPVPFRQQSFLTRLNRIARAAAFRLEREILVTVDSRVGPCAAPHETPVSMALVATLNRLAAATSPTTALWIEVTADDTVVGEEALALHLGFHETPERRGAIPAELGAADTWTEEILEPLSWAFRFERSERALSLRAVVQTIRERSGSDLQRLSALGDRTALVIDPWTARRTVLCELLGRQQMIPAAAESVGEAMQRIREAERANRAFDFILVVPDATPDHPVGDIWSTTTLDALLAEPGLPEGAEVIALSHLSAVGSARRSGRGPAFVSRPLNVPALLERLSAPPGTGPAQPREAAPDAGETHVLIAEDNAVNQLHLGRLLEQRGITSTIVNNGAEAVDRFLSDGPGTYAAILMDIQMPIMDGFEATQIIRTREARDGLLRTPIIAVTAHVMETERRRCLQVGMSDHITKPVHEGQLLSTLSRLTGRQLGQGRPLRRSGETGVESRPARRFNAQQVLEFAGNDGAFLRKLTEIFGRTTPKQLHELRAAAASGDREALRRTAHQLKGAVGNFGAESAMARAAALEKLADSATTARLDAEIAELEADIGWIQSQLEALCAEHPGG